MGASAESNSGEKSPAKASTPTKATLSLVPTRLRGNAVRTRQRPVPATRTRGNETSMGTIIKSYRSHLILLEINSRVGSDTMWVLCLNSD